MKEETIIKLIQSTSMEDKLLGFCMAYKTFPDRRHLQDFVKANWILDDDSWEIYIDNEINIVNFGHLGIFFYSGDITPFSGKPIYKI